MNILIINGSPKGENSNSMNLTRAFLNGALWPDAEVVTSAGIKPCSGCFACWNKTTGKCVLNDGMAEILSKLVAADVVIWSFPLYYFGVPGGLKNLIDRQLPLNLPFMAAESENGAHPARYDMSGQRRIVISTCGFWRADGNYDAVISMFNHFYGEGGYTAIFCGQGELFRVPELKTRTDKYLEIVRQAGAEFANSGIRAETLSLLAEPLYPREVYEKMADASWGIIPGESTTVNADDSLNFTKQMAALYKPDETERVLEFYYTDIGKTYQIFLSAKGAEIITDDFMPYTTRIETPLSVWRSIARGEISGQDALFKRKYKVLGDFSLMLKWDELFGSVTPKKHPIAEPKRKTNMTLLLAPWIVIWIAIAIHPVIGGAAGILAAVCVPLLRTRFRPVIYEQISDVLVASLSLTVLLGADVRLVVPAGYLLFGLMWVIGSLVKTPLSAHYSAAEYGGDSAFSNPIFMRTNRILTAAWGALYLVTPIWTYILMSTDISAYTGLINSACPILMGLFTAWFRKWYPARLAMK
ncbi:MAG: flavodoxin family protein [Clostridiales bacterium]|nr:flavodoxin family protein [Clostridiales bacterium]